MYYYRLHNISNKDCLKFEEGLLWVSQYYQWLLRVIKYYTWLRRLQLITYEVYKDLLVIDLLLCNPNKHAVLFQ